MHTHSPEEATIKKSRLRLGIPGYLLEGETHQQRKHQDIRIEEGEGGRGSHTKSTQPYMEIQLNSEEITQNKQLSKSK